MRSSFRNKLLKLLLYFQMWRFRRKLQHSNVEFQVLLRKVMDEMAHRSSFPIDCLQEKGELADVPVLWVQGTHHHDNGKVLLYLHGGAFMAGSPDTHKGMVARLCRASELRGCLVDYRLAPEHPYPAGLDDCVAAYKGLLELGHRPENIIIGGDSAGGNLSMATLLRLKDEGIPLPAGALNLSGCCDLTFRGASLSERQSRDPIVDARLVDSMLTRYGPDQDYSHPYLSPVNGNLQGLPPIYCAVGTEETLWDDVHLFAERAKDAGVEVILDEGEDMLHVWQIFIDHIPEAKASLKAMATFIRQRLRIDPARQL